MNLTSILISFLIVSYQIIDVIAYKNILSYHNYNNLITSSKLLSSTKLYAEIKNVGVVLLAGGKGKRMQSSVPKQFLNILGRPVFLRSLDIFKSMTNEVSSIVIVLDESYREEYKHLLEEDSRISWADPGAERQDSVFNGITKIPDDCSIIAIHDSARPLVTIQEVLNCLSDGLEHGAAVLGVPMKATVKESIDGKFVLRTIPRSSLWEIHTPQVSSKSLFLKGFEKVKKENLEVTDDVSVIEALGLPVKLTLGQYTNIKLTTPDDLQVAEQILRERGIIDFSSVNDNISLTIDNTNADDAKNFPCSSERYRDSLTTSNLTKEEKDEIEAKKKKKYYF